MSKKNIKSKVLEKLKKEQVKPKPKWQFVARNIAFWAAFILATLVGSLAMSLIIFKLLNADWDVYRRGGHNFFSFTFHSLPYLWILFFGSFSTFAYFNFRHTKGGYRQPMAIVILASLLVSTLLGFALYAFNISNRLDQHAMDRFQIYREFEFGPREEFWTQTEKGLLAGEVLEVFEDSFALEDFNSIEWLVSSKELDEKMLKPIEEGNTVAITGEAQEENNFTAETLRPWKGNHPPRAEKPHHSSKKPPFEKKGERNF